MPASVKVFSRYRNRIFIETGAFKGDGIKLALKAGFTEVISIELSRAYADYCRKRFRRYANVKILEGDSGEILGEVLKTIREPVTFWLDGHYSGSDTAHGVKEFPLLEELEHIRRHPINAHSILIDDIRLFGDGRYGFTPQSLAQELQNINAAYNIRYEDGFVANDILVATPTR